MEYLARKLITDFAKAKNLTLAPISVVDEFFNALVIIDGATRENTTIREKGPGSWELKLDIQERNVFKTYHLIETTIPRTYDFIDLNLDPALISKIFDVRIAYILTNENNLLTEIDRAQKNAFSDNVYLPVDVGVHFFERMTDIVGGRVDHTAIQLELREILGPEIVDEELQSREGNYMDIDKINIYADEVNSEIISAEQIDLLKQKFLAQKYEREKYEKDKSLKEYIEKMQDERKIKEEITSHRKERDTELNAYVQEIKERKHIQETKELLELEDRIKQRSERQLDDFERKQDSYERVNQTIESYLEHGSLNQNEKLQETIVAQENDTENRKYENMSEYDKYEKLSNDTKNKKSMIMDELISKPLPIETIERYRIEEERMQLEMMRQETELMNSGVNGTSSIEHSYASESVPSTYSMNNTEASSKGTVFYSNSDELQYTNRVNESIKNKEMEMSHMKITSTDFIINRDISWCEANIIKYVCRHREYGGLQDIEKAIGFVDKLIELKRESRFIHNKPLDTEVISSKEFIIKNQLQWVEGTIVKLIVESEVSNDIEKLEDVKELLKTIIEYQYYQN